MARCPNCGRETARTSDWGCQWCGYPLMSGNYKKLDKTYQEFREERMPPPPVIEEEPEPEPEPAVEPEPEPEPEIEPEPEPEPEPVVESEPEPEPEPEPKPKARRKAPAKAKAAKEKKAAAKPKTTRKRAAKKAEPEPEPGPEPEVEQDPGPGPEVEPEMESTPEHEVEEKPAEVDMELTVSELAAEYDSNGPEADAKLLGKIIKLSGVVERVEVKENLSINYVVLTAEAGNLTQGIRCNFGMQYSSEVSRLVVGQTVSIQGKYDGSIINMSLRDCVLVG